MYLCNVIYNSPSSHDFHVLNINITYSSLISYNSDCINDYPFQMSPQPKWILQQTWHIAILYLTFIFLEWICKILALASSLGCGNSIFLSNLPDLRRAGSKISTLLVAAITFRNRNSQFKSLHTMLSLHTKLYFHCNTYSWNMYAIYIGGFFFIFMLCSWEDQICEKCNRVNLKHFLNKVDLNYHLDFVKKFTRKDLIPNLRLEFTKEKKLF